MVWSGDCVEIFMDILNCKRGEYHFDDYHYIAGINGKTYVNNSRKISESFEVKTASKRKGESYTMEVAIGHAGNDLPALKGYIAGFEIRVLFSNGEGGVARASSWIGCSEPYKDTKGWGTLELR